MQIIKIKRGLKENLPLTLEAGELAYTTDTKELFIGSGSGVVLVSDIEAFKAFSQEIQDRLDNLDSSQVAFDQELTVNGKILELVQDIANLEQEDVSLNERIDSLKTEDIASGVITLKVHLDNIETDIGTLETGLTTLDGKVDSLKAEEIAFLNSNVKTKIDQIDTDIGNLSGNISSNSNSISALDIRVGSNEGSISDINQDITLLDTNLKETDDKAEGLKIRATNLETSVGALETDVSSLDTNLSGLDTRVTTTEGKISTLETKVGNNEGSISSLNTSLGTTNSNLSSIETRVSENEGEIESLWDSKADLDANNKVQWDQIPDAAKQQTYVVPTKNDRPTPTISGEKVYVVEDNDTYIWDGTNWILQSSSEWQNISLTWGNIEQKPLTATRWPAWSEVTNKPSNFTPSSHNHPWSDITQKPETATRWPAWNEVTEKPTTFDPSSHGHSALEITSGTLPVSRGGTGAVSHTLNEVLVGKGTNPIETISRSGIDTRSSFPPSSHSHTLSQITDSGDLAALDLDLNNSTSNYLRGDGSWTIPPNDNTTYTAGAGLELNNEEFSVINPFDPSGDYSNLRARATTKEDLGLGKLEDYHNGQDLRPTDDVEFNTIKGTFNGTLGSAEVGGLTVSDRFNINSDGLFATDLNGNEIFSIFSNTGHAYFGGDLRTITHEDTDFADQSLNKIDNVEFKSVTLTGEIEASNIGSVAAEDFPGGTTLYLRSDGSWRTPPNDNTTYTAGTGLELNNEKFSVTNPFNPSGDYLNLRARGTTAADVGARPDNWTPSLSQVVGSGNSTTSGIFISDVVADNVEIREEKSLKFNGGTDGSARMEYNKITQSIDFIFDS